MQSFANRWVIKNCILDFAQHYLPGGVRKGKEWVVGDISGNKGSSMNFCVDGDRAGLWIDNATRETGNPVSLVMRQGNLSFEEAIKEIEEVFHVPNVPEFRPRQPVKHKAEKEYAFCFVAEDKVTPLMMVHRYEYVNDDGEVTKESRPYKLTDDMSAWVPGAPEKRPLYRLDKLRHGTTVIAVEGEKKADYLASQLATINPKMDVVAWPMGANQAHLADWMPIYDRKVIIWPDNDEAGIKAAHDIKGILHTAAILPIPKDKPAAWDCGDATPKEIESILKPQETLPFVMLGEADGRYYFYIPKTQVLFDTATEGMTTNTLLYLAPLDWWIAKFPKVGKGGFTLDKDRAIDWINREQQEAGSFADRKIYGAGTDRIDGRLLVNCGNIVFLDGVETDERIGDGFLIKPEARISDPYQHEPEFDYQQVVDVLSTFNTDDPDLILGWICLAPICGLLTWRPHIWLTGRRGSGKSTLEHKVIGRLLGDWKIAVQGTATTEAGIRKAIGSSSLPVIFDEAEASKKEINDRNMARILQLITVSSTESEAKIAKGNGKKGEAYRIRNMFCLACTQPPELNPAEQSRISAVTMEAVPHGKVFRFDPVGNFVSRQVQECDKILEIVNESIKVVTELLDDGRFADQYGALYGAAIYMRANGMITLEQVRDILLRDYTDKLKQKKSAVDDDADEPKVFLQRLMNNMIRQGTFTYTISEIVSGVINDPYDNMWKGLLAQYGMKVKEGHLYITKNNPQLNEIGAKIHSDFWYSLLERDGRFIKGDKIERIGLTNGARYLKIPIEDLPIEVPNQEKGKVVDMFGKKR